MTTCSEGLVPGENDHSLLFALFVKDFGLRLGVLCLLPLSLLGLADIALGYGKHRVMDSA